MTGAPAGSPAEPRPLGKLAKRGVAISMLREGVTEVVLFPASMIAARLLTPAEFGTAAAALFFIQLSSRLADFGFTAALVRAKTITERHLSSVFVMSILIGIASFGLLTGLAPLVERFYGIPATGEILRVAAISFLISPFGAIPNALLDRQTRYRERAIVDWYYSLTFAVLGLVLAWLGFSYWSLVYARVAAVAAQVATQCYFAPWRPSIAFSTEAVREIASFAIGMHIKRLLEFTAGNFDNVIVGKLMGVTALGLYDKAYSTMNRILNRLTTGGPGVMYRIFALIHEDAARFRRAYSKVVMSASLLALPPLAALAVAAPQFITVLFGDQWHDAVVPFQILCAGAVLKLMNTYAGVATQASGRIWPEIWRQLLYIFSIVLGLYLLRSWGVVGAAVAVLAATCLMWAMMHVLLRRVTGLRWRDIAAPHVPAIVCAIGTATTAFAVQMAFGAGGGQPAAVLLLVMQGAAAGLFFLAFVLFAPLRTMRDVVDEMATDLVPGYLLRQPWAQWYLRFHTRNVAKQVTQPPKL
jgi:O-antigen/teichoic acid export membrane protein